MKKIKSLKEWYKESVDKEALLYDNEMTANRQLAYTMITTVLVMMLMWLLNAIGIFQTGDISKIAFACMIGLLPPSIVCLVLKGKGRWIKYSLMLLFICILSYVDCRLSFNVVLIMVVPVVMSCRYYSATYTRNIALFTVLTFTLSAYLGASTGIGRLDLNFYDPPIGSVITIESTIRDALITMGIDSANRIQEYMLYYYVPKLVIYSIVAIACVLLAKRGYNQIILQSSLASNKSRIDSELNLASAIQTNMLPNKFPYFIDHNEFDIYAKMEPAKEVGGDFYDFFMIDDAHVAVVIADVSGKGVPAAMYMVTTKTLIKDHMQMGLSPAETLTRVNNIICEENELGLFVTCWLGLFNYRTGKLVYSNAGHNPPLICINNKYDYLKSKPNLVLGGLEDVRYNQETLYLKQNDKLFLYTDGVTEATSIDNKLYGEENLIKYLSKNLKKDNVTLLTNLRKELEKFANGKEQSDDITMLVLEFKNDMKTKTNMKMFDASLKELDNCLNYINENLKTVNLNDKLINQIDVAAEEVFTNIANYAYPGRTGKAKVEINLTDKELVLIFKDSGIKFNPLDKVDPDITLDASSRPIGGLGIFMVKKIMDKVDYDYKDGMNILCMKKKF